MLHLLDACRPTENICRTGHPTNLVDGLSTAKFYCSNLVPVYSHIQMTSVISEFVGWPVLLIDPVVQITGIVSTFFEGWSPSKVAHLQFFTVEKPTDKIAQENTDEPLDKNPTTRMTTMRTRMRMMMMTMMNEDNKQGQWTRMMTPTNVAWWQSKEQWQWQ